MLEMTPGWVAWVAKGATEVKRFAIPIGAALFGWGLAVLWLFTLLRAGPPAVHAAAYTVCPAGPPTCNYHTIQSAVDAAGDGDVIKVAGGTYTTVNAYGGLAQIVYISKSITIRGGYSPAFAEPPDPQANPTTLDAQGKGRVISIIGTIHPTVEGLRITGGDLGRGGVGGGIYVVSASALIRNNWIFGNSAFQGGGAYLQGSASVLTGNTIVTNTTPAWGSGGGLYLHQSDALLQGNRVLSNTASYGGGLYLDRSMATIRANTVSFNTADRTGVLAGVASLSPQSPILSSGGGIVLAYSAATLVGNAITANTTDDEGGGLLVFQSPAILRRNTVIANRARYGGGALLSRSGATLTNNVIADNVADVAGSGLFIEGSSPRLLHTTLARNGGGDGSGVYVTTYPPYPLPGPGVSTMIRLTNTIVVSHIVGISVTAGNTVTLEATLWGTGAWANIVDWGGAGQVFSGTINVRGNPSFVAPDAGDYHIGPASAATDAGVEAGVVTDIDNQPRPYREPDLGADEYWPPGVLRRVYLPLVQRMRGDHTTNTSGLHTVFISVWYPLGRKAGRRP